MKVGLEKCIVISMVNGKWIEHRRYEVNAKLSTIAATEANEQYKYLDYLQNRGIIKHKAKEQIKLASFYFFALAKIEK